MTFRRRGTLARHERNAVPTSRPDAVSTSDTPDWSERDRLPLVALAIANLVPVVGVFLFDWNAHHLLLLYWLENLVVGGYTLLRMLHAGGIKPLFLAAFFSFHYGFFCAGHGMFILFVLGMGGGKEADTAMDTIGDSGGLMLPFEMLRDLFGHIAQTSPGLLTLPLLAFVVSHGVSTVIHHFIGKEDAGRDADDIMFDPYKRIVALHMAILVGAFFVMESGGGSAAPALMLLIAIKIAIDLHQHRSAHRKRNSTLRSGDNDAADHPIEP